MSKGKDTSLVQASVAEDPRFAWWLIYIQAPETPETNPSFSVVGGKNLVPKSDNINHPVLSNPYK